MITVKEIWCMTYHIVTQRSQYKKALSQMHKIYKKILEAKAVLIYLTARNFLAMGFSKKSKEEICTTT